jgi:hypothetical protein
MKKTTALKIVNPIIGLLFVSQSVTGVFGQIIPYDINGPIHKFGGYLFIAFVIIHIILNWSWIKSTLVRTAKKPVSSIKKTAPVEKVTENK